MKKLYDLAVKAGSYQTKDGNEKAVWLNIGAVWQGNDTICLTGENLFYIPLGVTNKRFIGENNTAIEIFYDDDVNLDEKNITVENAQVFLRTPVNIKMDNSKNIKVINGFKKRLEGDNLADIAL